MHRCLFVVVHSYANYYYRQYHAALVIHKPMHQFLLLHFLSNTCYDQGFWIMARYLYLSLTYVGTIIVNRQQFDQRHFVFYGMGLPHSHCLFLSTTAVKTCGIPNRENMFFSSEIYYACSDSQIVNDIGKLELLWERTGIISCPTHC